LFVHLTGGRRKAPRPPAREIHSLRALIPYAYQIGRESEKEPDGYACVPLYEEPVMEGVQSWNWSYDTKHSDDPKGYDLDPGECDKIVRYIEKFRIKTAFADASCKLRAEVLSAHAPTRWMDDAFAYRFPWGFNSLSVYLKRHVEAAGNGWPAVCVYYAAFVKYGVHEPVACALLSLGIPSRAAAARVGQFLADGSDSPESKVRRLQRRGIEHLVARGLPDEDAKLLRSVLSGHAPSPEGRSRSVTIRLRASRLSVPVPPGTRVIVERSETGRNRYRLSASEEALGPVRRRWQQ
jgi:hypothetical protein